MYKYSESLVFITENKMAQGNTIEAFKANMSKGFARPNLFQVEIAKVKISKQAL